MEDFFSPDVINASYTQWHLRYEELWQVLVLISWWRLSGLGRRVWRCGLSHWKEWSSGAAQCVGGGLNSQCLVFVPHDFSLWD